MSEKDKAKVEKIRSLNDLLRTTLQGGSIYMTSRIQSLGPSAVMDILHLVKSYPEASFEQGDDPYREHDFGTVLYRGQRVYWKIDYFDKEQKRHSEDPSDASLTHRVMMLMLSHEY